MRVRHLLPELNFFRRVGAPVDKALHHAGLPSEIELYPESFMPHRAKIQFDSYLQTREKIADLGWHVYGFYGFRFPDAMSVDELNRAGLVGARLAKFGHALSRANNFIRCRIAPASDGVRFQFFDSRRRNAADQPSSEWGRLMPVLALVQSGAGPDWRPPRIGFRSMTKPSDDAQNFFNGTKFSHGQATTWLEVPSGILALHTTPSMIEEAALVHARRQTRNSFGEIDYNSVSAMLRAILPPYLAEGCPTIDEAAEMLSSSRRTLQRRLRKEGLSYTSLINEIRMVRAMDLLHEDDAKIVDVSVATGFEYGGNFTRAFIRHTGLNPSAYRRRLRETLLS